MNRSQIRSRICLTALLSIVLIHVSYATAQEKRIRISYSELVAAEQVTHSGQRLTEALNQLAAAERIANAADQRARREQLRLMRADVEPFLEQYAFLLQDLIDALDPGSIKPNLVEIGALFPAGEAQPAWAELARSRRYLVLSDGQGYVRIFIPGSNASDAYKEHYGVVRHILEWIKRATAPATKIDLELFAYENDLSARSLNLYLPPKRLTLDSAPEPAGAVAPLGLGAIEEFLAKPLTLEGASLDGVGRLTLYGTAAERPMTLAGLPVSLADLAVAYRAVFYSEINRAYVSLDTGTHPEQVNVNFGGRLQDTHIGWVALRSDLRLKTLSVNLDPMTGEDLTDLIRKAIPDFSSKTERWLANSKGSPNDTTYEETRFWFYPDNIKLSLSDDRDSMSISSARFSAAAERKAAKLESKQIDAVIPPWTADTVANLNRNYDTYARLFPELQELDTAARLLALFAWLKERKDAGRLRLDLDALLSVELPKCSTPRNKPQMIVGFYDSDNSKPVASDYSWISELLIATREGGDAKAKLLLPGTYDQLRSLLPKETVAQVFTGGVDLDLSRVVSGSDKLPEARSRTYKTLVSLPDNSSIREPGAARAWARSNATTERGPTQARRVGPRLTNSERSKKVRDNVLSIRNLPEAGEEIITLVKPGGKPLWSWSGPENPLSGRNSRNLLFNPDGSVSGFTRYEGGRRLEYNLLGNGNEFAAARTPPSRRSTEADLAIAREALAAGSSKIEAWESLPEDTDIVGLDRMPDGRLVVLRQKASGYELLREEGESFAVAATGPEALSMLHGMAREQVRRASTDAVSFVHASVEGDRVIFQVGDLQKAVPIADVERLMRSPKASGRTLLDELLQSSGSDNKDLIVYRDMTTRRPMRMGGSLKEESADNPVLLIDLLRRRYPGRRVFLDDEFTVAKRNRQSLRPVRRVTDIGALIPEESFDVIDHGMMKRIKGVLESDGVRVFGSADALLAHERGSQNIPNILFISGHNDESLVAYLNKVGEKGALKGKVIILNTCYAKGNSNLAHDLIQKYGAIGVRLHLEKIRPVALESLMREMGGLLREAGQSGKEIHPDDLLDQAIERALQNGKPRVELRKELQKLRRSILQVSKTWLPTLKAESVHGE
ncbi:MAG TPA: hypothetical protein VKA70_18270 [Blastocatellia bacterium]|nr:hypothetical protein [Blastocatellia bacterium]